MNSPSDLISEYMAKRRGGFVEKLFYTILGYINISPKKNSVPMCTNSVEFDSFSQTVIYGRPQPCTICLTSVKEAKITYSLRQKSVKRPTSNLNSPAIFQNNPNFGIESSRHPIKSAVQPTAAHPSPLPIATVVAILAA